jgi:hypothetical protein
VQTRSKGRKFSRNSKIESEHGSEDVDILLKEIQALLAPHGVEEKTVLTAFNQILLEIKYDKSKNNIEEFRSLMLGMIVWKIFAAGSTLWIDSITKAGHEVPLDLLVDAYSVWRNALNLAAKGPRKNNFTFLS